ncbi:MAG TPA: CopG family transcriptional regulator [Tetrasphaera sp.]|uniref:ribbon-helix-helix domain-containing protein n=1 Tax=Nostocoides sp. TaxID=1917966 RepID=UPI002CFC3AF2|nr:CopG family transcriptional regulator [Tetrasphaera sp.]HNQ08243.1 CopG family transcriptional regulator [Tetrasphaera sp.]
MKTTLYLPDDVKRAVEVEARRRGISEAEVVRDALRRTLLSGVVRPRGALFTGSEPVANRVDELLAEGFGS